MDPIINRKSGVIYAAFFLPGGRTLEQEGRNDFPRKQQQNGPQQADDHRKHQDQDKALRGGGASQLVKRTPAPGWFRRLAVSKSNGSSGWKEAWLLRLSSMDHLISIRPEG